MLGQIKSFIKKNIVLWGKKLKKAEALSISIISPKIL